MPGVASVVRQLVQAKVLGRELTLHRREHLVRLPGARYLSDHLDGSAQFHPPKFEVVMAGIHHDGDPQVALQVRPSLAAVMLCIQIAAPSQTNQSGDTCGPSLLLVAMRQVRCAPRNSCRSSTVIAIRRPRFCSCRLKPAFLTFYWASAIDVASRAPACSAAQQLSTQSATASATPVAKPAAAVR